MTSPANLELILQPSLPAQLPEQMTESINAALYSKKLSDCEFAVLSVLVYANPAHAGHERAISIGEMQDRWRRCGDTVWADRSIKAAAKSLLEEHGVKVGSSRGSVPGYFLIVTAKDAAVAAAPMIAEIKSLAARCRKIGLKAAYIQQLHGQEVL